MSNAMQKLLDKVNKAKSSGGFEDPHADKFWKVESDAAGNGYAVIRFLPGKTDDDDVFVKTYSHGFKNAGGKWFIENCPTTIGNECPVCVANGVLWNSGIESNKDTVRQRKRKVSYTSNVLIISDSKHPENEGKVFLFKYGQKIFEKVVGAMQPEFEDETPINPFDLVEGANFKLKMRRVEGFANFDKSEFDKIEAVDKKKVKEIMDASHDLSMFTSPDQFKSYEDIEAKLKKVLGAGAPQAPKALKVDEDDVPKSQTERQQRTGGEDKVDTDDDDMDYFKSLVDED